MISVVGGTYNEFCADPHLGWRLMGSGLRATLQCLGLGAQVSYSTCIGADDAKRLAGLMANRAINRGDVREITRTISFLYDHPLSTPVILPTITSSPVTLSVDSECLLQFGMLEAVPKTNAKRAVYDPQSKYSPVGFFESGCNADELAIIANVGEGRLLTRKADVDDIASAMLQDPRVRVVVLKQGPEGARLFTQAGMKYSIPARRTSSVMKIGSGDIFSSAFCVAWALNEVAPVDAANFASAATAAYCDTGQIPDQHSVEEALSTLAPLNFATQPRDYRIYLAGPFFTTGQRWMVNQARNALLSLGFHVFSPFHDVGVGRAEDVVPADVQAINDCSAVYALVDGCDAGTLFELGYARALGKPVIAFSENEPEEPLKMLQGTSCIISNNFAGSIYRLLWELSGVGR